MVGSEELTNQCTRSSPKFTAIANQVQDVRLHLRHSLHIYHVNVPNRSKSPHHLLHVHPFETELTTTYIVFICFHARIVNVDDIVVGAIDLQNHPPCLQHRSYVNSASQHAAFPCGGGKQQSWCRIQLHVTKVTFNFLTWFNNDLTTAHRILIVVSTRPATRI